MRNLALPVFDANDVFLHCVAEVTAPAQRDKFLLHQPNLAQGAEDYSAHSATRTWCLLPRSTRGRPEQIVSGNLSKAELVGLYDSCMVGATGQARRVYDALLVAAGGKCPYCAGIGQVKTLDHYLPKSVYPLHAVNPLNLVPSCRDCNTGKNAAFPFNPADQSIHPYIDSIHFFNERWVFAEVSPGDPVTVQFYAAPPAPWSEVDRSRALTHFHSNDLPLRYSIQCGGVLGMVIGWRQGSLRHLTPQEFSAHLMEGAAATSFPINGWERTLYFGLASSEWFCSTSF